jgi:hypothetical protein
MSPSGVQVFSVYVCARPKTMKRSLSQGALVAQAALALFCAPFCAAQWTVSSCTALAGQAFSGETIQPSGTTGPADLRDFIGSPGGCSVWPECSVAASQGYLFSASCSGGQEIVCCVAAHAYFVTELNSILDYPVCAEVCGGALALSPV